jgi:hypothetical protein
MHHRLSRHELLPLHRQGLNFVAWGRRCDQHCHVEIAARDSPAASARVHYQDRIHMRVRRKEIPGQISHISVEVRWKSER